MCVMGCAFVIEFVDWVCGLVCDRECVCVRCLECVFAGVGLRVGLRVCVRACVCVSACLLVLACLYACVYTCRLVRGFVRACVCECVCTVPSAEFLIL